MSEDKSKKSIDFRIECLESQVKYLQTSWTMDSSACELHKRVEILNEGYQALSAEIRFLMDAIFPVKAIGNLSPPLIYKSSSEAPKNIIYEEERLKNIESHLFPLGKNKESRLERIEKENAMMQDTIACVDQAYDKASVKISDRVDKLEEKMAERMVSREEFEKMRSQVNTTEIYQMPPPGEPNKCPLCSGSGVNNNLVLTVYPPIYPECINCKGKGIV